ncbi:hypothetical protein HHX47_DHR8000248 [Lentinula edodes]|nr:hypothetical protein HHX47_DHR8000248 [Lentinula edodes]
MNTPNWERTHAIHHSRTNFPVQPLSEMTLRLEDVIRIQEDLTARLVPNPVHVPPRLSNPSVIPYQGSVSMQSQAVGAESQRGPNQRRTLAVHEEAVPPQGAPFGTPFVTGAQMNQPGMAFDLARSQESAVMIQQQAQVIETLQEQLREVRKGFTTGEIPTGGSIPRTGNMAGVFGQAPMVVIGGTRGGPSPVVPQPRSWQATEPISFTRRTPIGVKEGNPQEGQTAPLPATPSVDRRRIQEWGARMQRAELGEYVRLEGGRYAVEDGGVAASGGGRGGFRPPDREPPPHLSSQTRDRERPLSQGGRDQRRQEERSGGGAPPPPPPPPPPSGGPGDNDSEGSNKGERTQSSRNGGRNGDDGVELLKYLQLATTRTNPGIMIPNKVGIVKQLLDTPMKDGTLGGAMRRKTELPSSQNLTLVRSKASQVTTGLHGRRGSSVWKGCLEYVLPSMLGKRTSALPQLVISLVQHSPTSTR